MEYFSVFMKFKTEKECRDFFVKHLHEHTLPMGGPIFSWSCEDESIYRDALVDIVRALDDCRNLIGRKVISNVMPKEQEHAYNVLQKHREAIRQAGGYQ